MKINMRITVISVALIIILSLLLLLQFTGCSVIPPKWKLQSMSWSYSSSNLDSFSSPDAKKYLVEGVAKNTGNQTLTFAEIIAKFWDKEGNYLDYASDYAFDLAPGTTWRFAIIYWDWDGKVSEITVEIGSIY